MTKEANELASAERRNFLKLTGTGAFTAAMVAGAAGTLWSSKAVAQTANEEREREAAADHVMTLATEYVIGTTRSYPMMQLDVKENLQNASNGKIYVKLAPGGQLGTGSALAQKVQGGTVNAGQFSLSNFAPFAPAVDRGQRDGGTARLQADVLLLHRPARHGGSPGRQCDHHAGRSSGCEVPRAGLADASTVLSYGRRQPDAGCLGRNAFGDQTRRGRCTRPVGALYVFGFKDILSHVTFTQAVPDSQCYACNLEWFSSLPGDVQEAVEWASEMSFHQNLAKVPSARTFAMAEMRKAGVEFHSLTDDQLAEWKDTVGYQRSEWDSFKTELAGSMETFDKLVEAADTKGRYYVHDA